MKELEALEAEDPEKINAQLEAARVEIGEAQSQLGRLASNGDVTAQPVLFQLRRLQTNAIIAAARNRTQAIEQGRLSKETRGRILSGELTLARARLEKSRERISRIEEAITRERRDIAA